LGAKADFEAVWSQFEPISNRKKPISNRFRTQFEASWNWSILFIFNEMSDLEWALGADFCDFPACGVVGTAARALFGCWRAQIGRGSGEVAGIEGVVRIFPL
jgi:hypothetical protein